MAKLSRALHQGVKSAKAQAETSGQHIGEF
jgi:hypothetical protein